MSTRTHRLTRTTGLALSTILAAGATLALATPAFASPLSSPNNSSGVSGTGTGPTLAELQAKGAAAISQREAQLTTLAGRLAAAPGCDAQGAVGAEISNDGPALRALGAKLAAAGETLAQARVDYAAIFTNYRVYLVVTPQASTTAACGHIEMVAAILTGDEATLGARVAAARSAGANMSGAQAALQDMAAKVADATAHGNQAYSTLASIVPDKGDKAIEASNAEAVVTAHADLVTAHADLSAAYQDARTVVAALKAVHP